MSFQAQKRYINPRDDRIKTNILWNDADNLPQRHRNFQAFKSSFGNVNHYEFEIAGCFIVIDVKYAYNHIMKNSYNDPRANINATILPTQNDLHHIVMFKAYQKENGKYYFKTIYDVGDNLNKVKKIIKTLDRNTLYFKYTEGNGS